MSPLKQGCICVGVKWKKVQCYVAWLNSDARGMPVTVRLQRLVLLGNNKPSGHINP